jgi:hypothetical protein
VFGAKVVVDGERHLRELAALVPTAAGFFFDTDGQLVVSLLESASRDQEQLAEEWVEREAVSANIRGSDGNIVRTAVSRVSEDRPRLSELLEWRDTIESEVLASDGFVLLDLDEREGKLVIGVTADAYVSRFRSIAERAGAPSKVVAVDVRRIAPDWPNYPIPANLLSRARPLGGGVQVGPLGCTLGIAANLPDGSPMLMTNGHCSYSMGFPDGTGMDQPLGAGHVVGTEFHDYSWACSGGRCDHADLGLYSTSTIDFNSSIFEEPYELGLIWRPENRVQGPTNSGSTNVDQTFPRLVATGMQTYAVMNQTVDKVGHVTGWTYGQVYQTCTSFNLTSTYKVHCSDFASYTRNGGDSGGPVFIHYPAIPPSEGGNGVSFLGLHFARDLLPNGTSRGGVFSNTNQIRNEIGQFRFW